MGCLDALWMKVGGKVQQNGAILLIKSHKLDPRPIDEDSKPVQSQFGNKVRKKPSNSSQNLPILLA